MATTPGAKSQGMKFAEKLLHRHGWTEGKGLGRRESGISEAIKVKVKCDSAGVGHNSAEQFTFHWWDHVFNKTASSISVEPDQDGVQVKKVTDDDNSAVTNKKPRKALTNRDMLYGRFIKSATLLSGGEKPVEKESSSSDSSEDEDEKLDLSSATKLTDDDLVKICGGRTAHKGARHGLTMSAKLLRVEEQERTFLEKYGKKEPSGEPAKPSRGLSSDTKAETGRKKEKSRPVIANEDVSSNTTQPKKKKKRKTVKDEALEEDGTNGQEEHVPWKEEDTMTSKRNVDSEDLLDVLSGEASSNKTVEEDPARGLNHGQLLDLKYSKKKKKKVAGEEVTEEAEDHARAMQEDVRSSKKKRKVTGESVKEEAEDPEDHARGIQEDVRSSKKKKRKDEGKEEEEEKVEELLCGHQDWAPSELSKKKRKSRRDLEEKVEEERDESTEEHVQSGKKKKQKKVEEVDDQASMEEERCQTIKKKKSKNKYRDPPTPEEEPEQAVEGAEHRSKSKKKRKE
ncbi:PREDICTED: G patch domain-containing protein 4 [Nanorana parkeri]|uniref:G patch domain-containing protein 4 n=1 Tax=Nanorana parkeri TaxID=125878 RepID=UPI000854781C|nr:PREDICTED: G patch domain-containing protein 4 [Nanorana parkeri]